MEKECKNSGLKTSPITLLNFGRQPKTANACKIFSDFEKRPQTRCFKRDREKVNLIFPLLPVPIYGQDHEKQKTMWNQLPASL